MYMDFPERGGLRGAHLYQIGLSGDQKLRKEAIAPKKKKNIKVWEREVLMGS